MPYLTVITADVIDSRRHENIRRRLEERLPRLEHPLLLTPFTVSRGDELQAVCQGVLAAPELVRRLRHACLPLVLRIGVGLGPADFETAASSWDMSGEAFFRARDAMERLKPGKHPRTRLLSGDARFDTVANGLFELLDTTWMYWTAAQWEAVMAYEREGTYGAAGAVLGIALQNVEKRCKAARWASVRAGEAALRTLGDWYGIFTRDKVNQPPSPDER